MDERNTIDIGNMLMNSEGVCPNCEKPTTILESLFSARQAGISDVSVCCCPQCHHVYRYELNDGKLVFTEDVTAQFSSGSPEERVRADEAPEEKKEDTGEAKPKKKKAGKKKKAEEKAEEKTVEIPLEEPAPAEVPAAEEASPLPPQMPLASAGEEEEIVQEIIEEFKFSSSEGSGIENPAAEEEMKFCPKCGKSIPARARFCPYCRKALTENRALANLKKYRVPAAIALAVIAIIAALVIYLPNASKRKAYNTALNHLKAGEYQQAVTAFSELGDYQKAPAYVKYCQGVMKFNEGRFEDAGELFRSAGSIENSYNYLSYLSGIEKLAARSVKSSEYTEAADAFDKAKDIADAAGMAAYSRAVGSFVSDNTAEAVSSLTAVVSENSIASDYISQAREILSYIDAVSRLESGEENALEDLAGVLSNCGELVSRKSGDYGSYIEAMNYYKEKKFYTAMCIFNSISDFRDSQKMAESCLQSRPSSGIVYRSGSSKSVGLTIYDNSDGDDMFVKIYNSSDTLVETLYIRDGSKATAYLPAGSFRIALAVGKGSEWYGPVETFGPEGTYQRLLLTGSGEYYSFKSGKYTLKFNVSNGNVNHTYTDYGDV
ncbi:MAG: DUF2116 family Zn-ribbon domain-containing protein [Erysipelotrichaceae bacterium]|nr:DUF2116 family Zn-ribbon domain-containing protein [Erysipelotrichaceae bacterium]